MSALAGDAHRLEETESCHQQDDNGGAGDEPPHGLAGLGLPPRLGGQQVDERARCAPATESQADGDGKIRVEVGKPLFGDPDIADVDRVPRAGLFDRQEQRRGQAFGQTFDE